MGFVVATRFYEDQVWYPAGYSNQLRHAQSIVDGIVREGDEVDIAIWWHNPSTLMDKDSVGTIWPWDQHSRQHLFGAQIRSLTFWNNRARS